MRTGVHVICGGFPPGASAGHDMAYARDQLLGLVSEKNAVPVTSAENYDGLEAALADSQCLITYVAGPYPEGADLEALEQWLNAGGRWFALHGSSGGKAVRLADRPGRAMVKMAHHEALGSFFLNHPPLRKFQVDVVADHPLTRDLPARFEVEDELYLIEVLGPVESLFTTRLPEDPSPRGFGFHYEKDTSLQDDGVTRVLGYEKKVGRGRVAYVALGHCHSPESNSQPFVDKSVSADRSTPRTFRGAWETDAFRQILENAVSWGLATQA